MDFIEQIFGIAPDGGSGLLEVLLFAVPLTGLVALYYYRRVRPPARKKLSRHY